MSKQLGYVLVAAWLLAAWNPCPADEMVDITFEAADLGGGRWEYTYDVTNHALTIKIEEFTLWFDFGSYEDLTVTTPTPPAGNWDELVVQPEPLLSEDGFYDALVLDEADGIDTGETVEGFSVSFDWLGLGAPGPQSFEIIDPDTFEAIHTGTTTPEPAALVLLLLGSIVAMRRRP